MDFGRVLEAILEGFWMPKSMQKSIEFWMDSRRGSGMILASKIGQNHSKNESDRILKTLISHGEYSKNECLEPSCGIHNVFKNRLKQSLIFH